jgi:hypothetical protein
MNWSINLGSPIDIWKNQKVRTIGTLTLWSMLVSSPTRHRGHACLAAHRLWAPKEVQQDCSLMPHIDLQVGIQPAGWGEGGGVMVVAVRADATLALNSPWLLRLVGLIGVASLCQRPCGGRTIYRSCSHRPSSLRPDNWPTIYILVLEVGWSLVSLYPSNYTPSMRQL